MDKTAGVWSIKLVPNVDQVILNSGGDANGTNSGCVGRYDYY